MNRRSQVAAAVGVIALVGVAVGTTPAGAADHGAAASHAPPTITVSPEMAAAAKAAAAAGTNYIGNDSLLGLGVMHIQDGVYTQGSYDAVLPAESDTNGVFGWANAAAGTWARATAPRSSARTTAGSPGTRRIPTSARGSTSSAPPRTTSSRCTAAELSRVR